jgi:hypothetical protein
MKPESILDRDSVKRKLSKLSPRDRRIVKRRIIQGEKMTQQWLREEEALKRMPKQERLKTICADYFGLAVDSAIGLGRVLEARGIKGSNGGIVKDLKTRLRSELTIRLKKFGVLPL